MQILPVDEHPLTPDERSVIARQARLSYERYGDRCDRARLEAAGRSALERWTGQAGGRTWTARCGDWLAGAGSWSTLAWDSEVFGFPAARLHFLLSTVPGVEGQAVQTALCYAVLDDARDAGIRHLTARVDAANLDAIQVLEGAGFTLIDGLQTFSLPLDGKRYGQEDGPCVIRGFQSEDLEPVCAIARSAYVFDRFHADTALAPGVADRLHETWVRNSCLGHAADHVVVAESGGAVAGFVTCRLDREAAPVLGGGLGVIVLVATAAGARGRGVARSATLGALDWFRGQGAAIVEVGTQMRNIPAGRLYETCGFRLIGVSITLRRVL